MLPEGDNSSLTKLVATGMGIYNKLAKPQTIAQASDPQAYKKLQEQIESMQTTAKSKKDFESGKYEFMDDKVLYSTE